MDTMSLMRMDIMSLRLSTHLNVTLHGPYRSEYLLAGIQTCTTA